MKRLLSMLLVLALLMGMVPVVPVQAATLTLAQLREKFPHGKYWNHVDNPGAANNDQDGYSDRPCPRHGNIGSSSQTCNGFAPHGKQQSWQCMGFAEKLGYDATGKSPRDSGSGWVQHNSSSALSQVKPGDIVRSGGHSVYVTAVEGELVTFADCNYYSNCEIRWDATTTLTKLKSGFEYVQSAPVAQEPEESVWSADHAGTYQCTTQTSYLNIRSGAGTGYSILGSIPPGGLVQVTAATGSENSDWAQVTYNGITGFCSMQYLKKTAIRFSNVSMNLGNSLTMYFKLNVAEVPDGCKAVITKNYADGRAPAVTEIPQSGWLVEGELYSVPVNNIAAKEMSDIISVVIVDADGLEISENKQSSIRAYAMATLNDANSSPGLLTLMAELLNYGAAAQTQFGYGTADLANARMNATHQSYAAADTGILAPKANRGDAIKVQSFNMVLESSLLLNLKYNTSEVNNTMKAVVSYTSHAGTAVSYEIPGSQLEIGTDGYLWVSLDRLAAADINTVATVEIVSNGAVISTTQINMAVAVAIDNGATPAVTAMSRYCVAAYNFFH